MPRVSFLPFAKPDMGAAEIEAVSAVIASGWLTTGAQVKKFEEEFASYLGVKHAIAVNSATAAMHLALEAAGIRQGDEVITSTFTFAATAEVIRYFDARPVLVDIEPDTLNLDVQQVAAAVTPQTKAIIPVHVGGLAANIAAIHEIAERHHLRVIEDAAHALPTHYRQQMVGSISDFTAFSFYTTKSIATGEGGMLTTNNDEWAARCRIMSLHGINKDAWKRLDTGDTWFYEIVEPGFKYNMTDIMGALGRVQLSKVDAMTERRHYIAARYNAAFGQHPTLEIPACTADSTHAYHLYTLRLNLDRLQIDRAEFIRQLKAANIGVSVHWMPLHMHPYYQRVYHYQPQDFPIAYQQYLRCISMPIYSAMSDEDVEDVIEATLAIADQHS